MGTTVAILGSNFVNVDGTFGGRSVSYEMAADGSLFATERFNVPVVWDIDIINMKMKMEADAVNGNSDYFSNRPSGQKAIYMEDILFLRTAVEKGLTTTAQVLKVLGDIPVAGASPLNFYIGLPDKISAADAAKYDTGNLATSLKVKDVFAVVSPMFDNSAIKGGSFPWSIPEGTTFAQAVANQWANSSNPTISGIVKSEAIKNGVLPVDMSWKTDTHVNDAQKVYIAYFGRPADVEGIKTTEDQIRAAGGDKSAITSMFANSPESMAFYAGKTVEQKVDTIYTQLFGRHAEQAGLDYWVHQLELGLINQVTMGIKIVDGAMLTDLSTINNRVAAANYFTEHIKTTDYVGNNAASNGRMFLSSIGSDAGDLTKAYAAVQSPNMSSHMSSGSVHTDITLVGLNVGEFFIG